MAVWIQIRILRLLPRSSGGGGEEGYQPSDYGHAGCGQQVGAAEEVGAQRILAGGNEDAVCVNGVGHQVLVAAVFRQNHVTPHRRGEQGAGGVCLVPLVGLGPGDGAQKIGRELNGFLGYGGSGGHQQTCQQGTKNTFDELQRNSSFNEYR